MPTLQEIVNQRIAQRALPPPPDAAAPISPLQALVNQRLAAKAAPPAAPKAGGSVMAAAKGLAADTGPAASLENTGPDVVDVPKGAKRWQPLKPVLEQMQVEATKAGDWKKYNDFLRKIGPDKADDPAAGFWRDMTSQDVLSDQFASAVSAERAKETVKIAGESISGPQSLQSIGKGISQGQQRIGNLLVRGVEKIGLADPGTADAGNLSTEARNVALDQMAGGSWLQGALRGAGSSLFQAAAAAATGGGTLAAPALAGATKANEAYSEARRAGKSEAEATAFAQDQGLIEGVITAVSGKVAGRLGAATPEEAFSAEAAKQISKTLTEKYVIKPGIGLLAEASEELGIDLLQEADRRLHGVNPSEITPGRIADVIGQTLVMVGLANATTAGGRELAGTPNAGTWATENPDAAQVLMEKAAAGKEVTRADFAKLNLPVTTGSDARQAFAAEAADAHATIAALKTPEGAATFAAANPAAVAGILADPTRGNIAKLTGTSRGQWGNPNQREKFVGALRTWSEASAELQAPRPVPDAVANRDTPTPTADKTPAASAADPPGLRVPASPWSDTPRPEALAGPRGVRETEEYTPADPAAAARGIADTTEYVPEPWQQSQSEFVAAAPKPDAVGAEPTFESLAANLRQEPTGGVTEGPIPREVTAPAAGKPNTTNIEPMYVSGASIPNGTNVVHYGADGRPDGILQIEHDAYGNPVNLVVAVDPGHRRKGIASGLYAKAAEAFPGIESVSGAGGYTDEGAKLAHARAVKDAAARGEAIPPDVLKDYPGVTVDAKTAVPPAQPDPVATAAEAIPSKPKPATVSPEVLSAKRKEVAEAWERRAQVADKEGDTEKANLYRQRRDDALAGRADDRMIEKIQYEQTEARTKEILDKALPFDSEPAEVRENVERRLAGMSDESVTRELAYAYGAENAAEVDAILAGSTSFLEAIQKLDKRFPGKAGFKTGNAAAIRFNKLKRGEHGAEAGRAAPKKPHEPKSKATPKGEPVDPATNAKYKKLTGHDITEIVEPTSGELAEADRFMKKRGKRVKFFRSSRGGVDHSFYDPTTKTTWINADQKGAALWYAVGHEFAHASGADTRLADLPPELLEAARQQYAAGVASPEYRKRLDADPEMWTREAVAVYMGNVLADPALRAKLQAENPTLWAKLVEAVRSIVGKFKSPEIERVLGEFKAPKATVRSDDANNTLYTEMANPLKGTPGGDALDATRDAMGVNIKPKWTLPEVAAAAGKAVDADKAGVRSKLNSIHARGENWTHEQMAEAAVLVAREATSATTADELAAADRFRRTYTEQRSKAGSALRVGQEDLFASPEGRQVLLVDSVLEDSEAETAELEKAREFVRKQGGDPGLMLSDVPKDSGGLMLSNATLDRAVNQTTAEDKAKLNSAWKDNNKARAMRALLAVERKIAARKLEFRSKMEAKGLLPTTPAGFAALVADPDAFRHSMREIHAHKNLGRGINGVSDAVYEAWVSNLISGLKTATVNIGSTPLNYTAHFVPRIGAAILNKATGSKHGPQLGEFAELAKALPDAIAMAWSNACRSFWHQTSMVDEQSGKSGSSLEGHGKKYAIPGRAGWMIRAPGIGVSLFGDDLTRTFIAHLEVRAHAYRAAVEQGIPAAGRSAFIDAQVNNRQSDAWQGADDYANRMALQEEGGAIRKKVLTGVSSVAKIPLMRWVFPFKRIPINMAAQFAEWTPLHFWGVTREVYGNVANGRPVFYGVKEELAKATIGTLAILAIMQNVEDDEPEGDFGITTSSHPRYPNSFRFGDKYVSYKRIEPFGAVMAAQADSAAAFRKDGFSAVAPAAFASIGDNVINKPVMRGVKMVADFGMELGRSVREGDGSIATDAAGELAADYASSFLPKAAMQFGEASGDEPVYDRRKRQIAEALNLGSVKVASQYDAWGRKKSKAAFGNPVGDYAWRLLTPIDIKTEDLHDGDKMMGRWNARADADKRFKLPELSPSYVDKSGKRQTIPPEQFQRFVKLAGEIAAKLFDAHDFDIEHPTAVQMETLTELFDTARSEARDVVKKEIATGKPQEADPEQMAKLIRTARLKALQRQVATKVPTLRRTGEAVDEFKDRREKTIENRTSARQELARWRSGVRPSLAGAE